MLSDPNLKLHKMTGRKDLFEESMRLGNSAAWNLEWDKAIEHYRKALDEFPESSEALSSLGLGLLETGKTNDALAAYHRAARADPQNPIALEKCAEIFEQLGQANEALEQRDAVATLHMKRQDIEKALVNWTHVARLAPDNLDARSRLAMTYERMGRTKEAVIEYLAVASILQRSGNPDRAIEATQRVLSMAPGDADAIRAYRMLRQGEPLPEPPKPITVSDPVAPTEQEAFLQAEQEQLEKELEGPADPEEEAMQDALGLLAGIILATPSADSGDGRRSKAKSRRSRLGTGKISGRKLPEISRHLSTGIELISRGHKRGAARVIQLALESGADSPPVRFVMGLLLKDIGDHTNAREHLIASLGEPRLALGANLALGRLARAREDMEEAAHFLLEALRMADTLSVGSEQTEQLNRLYESIKATQTDTEAKGVTRIVENALRFLSGPEWLKRIRSTRKQLETQQEGEEVVPIAEMLVVGGSDRAILAMERIDELVERGQHTTAMEEAMLALSRSPGYLPLHARMAEMMIHGGRVDEGVKKLITIGETHAARGEHERSAEVMATVLKHAPVNLEIRERLIAHLMSIGRLHEALEHYLEMAELYKQMAQSDEARQALAEALELAQSTGADKERLKQILHEMGDIDLARLDLRKGVEVYGEIRKLDADDEIARANLVDLNLRLGEEAKAAKELDGYLDLLVRKGQSAKALDTLEKLVGDHPGKQALHARLAEAYKAAGRKADAIAQYDALGEIQLDAGRKKEAAKTIKTILKLDPPDVEGYRELLRNIEAGG
jgi:tetratricopeptide (TPR) repeat protein